MHCISTTVWENESVVQIFRSAIQNAPKTMLGNGSLCNLKKKKKITLSLKSLEGCTEEEGEK